MACEIKKSFCYLCLADCGINVSLDKQENIINIKSNFEDPVSQGYICGHAQKLKDHQTSAERITSPLKRVDGNYVNISWEQALTEIATKLSSLINSNQTDRIFYMAPTVAMQGFTIKINKELMAMMGSKFNTDIMSAERMHKYTIDSEFYSSHIYPDRELCQTLIILGKNSWVTNQYARARKILNDIKNNPSRNLVVIDPCDTETSKMADLHIKIKPGTDAWFISALINILINDGFIDQQHVTQNFQNFQIIKDHFSKIDLQEYLIICGISRTQIDQLATLIANSNGVAIDSGNGVDHSVQPYTVFYLLNILVHITDNYQIPGGMTPIFSFFPTDTSFSEKVSPFTKQIQLQGVTSFSILSKNLYFDEENKFKAIIIDSNNPAARVPDKHEFKEQLAKIDLVIVLDSFITETTQLADYVLPITTFFENYEGTGHENFKSGYIRLCQPILTKPNFAKYSQDVLEEILVKMGLIDISRDQLNIQQYLKDPNQFLANLYKKSTDGQITDTLYIIRKTLGTKYDNSIIAVIWWYVLLFYVRHFPNKDLIELINYTHTQIDKLISTSMLYVTEGIDPAVLYTSKKIDLAPSYTRTLLKLRNSRIHCDSLPFVLISGVRQLSSFNGLIKSQESPHVEINIDDANELGIVDGNVLTITTKTGSLDLQCKINIDVPRKTLRMPNCHLINELTASSNVDYANPQYKHVFANIKLNESIQ
jgi:formate dehydrogenase